MEFNFNSMAKENAKDTGATDENNVGDVKQIPQTDSHADGNESEIDSIDASSIDEIAARLRKIGDELNEDYTLRSDISGLPRLPSMATLLGHGEMSSLATLLERGANLLENIPYL